MNILAAAANTGIKERLWLIDCLPDRGFAGTKTVDTDNLILIVKLTNHTGYETIGSRS
jgi:hypothetical protein